MISLDVLKEFLVILAGYVLGCFSTGYYLVRFRIGEDIRNRGSGSVGARNVGRTLGLPGFVVTFLGDSAKGAIAVWGASFFGLTSDDLILVMLAVVVGHNWPVQLGFHGGKGVATATGAMLVFDYQLAVAVIALIGLIYVFVRHFTVSGLLAFPMSPAVALLLGYQGLSVIGITLLVVVILIAHWKDIRAILRMMRQKSVTRATKPSTPRGSPR